MEIEELEIYGWDEERNKREGREGGMERGEQGGGGKETEKLAEVMRKG